MNESNTFAVRAMTIGAMVALGLGAVSASAAGPSNLQLVNDGAKQYVVRFADLDLSKTAGAAALYARLRHAARAVCEPMESREIGIAAIYRACMDQAVANAVAGVNSPLLTQYHQWHAKGDKSRLVQVARAN